MNLVTYKLYELQNFLYVTDRTTDITTLSYYLLYRQFVTYFYNIFHFLTLLNPLRELYPCISLESKEIKSERKFSNSMLKYVIVK